MTTTAAAGAETADGRDGGLSVVLTAEPSAGPIGSPVMFTLQATETHAPGALSYRVAYGDGATASNVTPEFCTAGPGPAANQTWSLSHTYAAPGHYSVVATVGVNCSSDTSTITLALNTT
jgi:PKD repeat protein